MTVVIFLINPKYPSDYKQTKPKIKIYYINRPNNYLNFCLYRLIILSNCLLPPFSRTLERVIVTDEWVDTIDFETCNNSGFEINLPDSLVS